MVFIAGHYRPLCRFNKARRAPAFVQAAPEKTEYGPLPGFPLSLPSFHAILAE